MTFRPLFAPLRRDLGCARIVLPATLALMMLAAPGSAHADATFFVPPDATRIAWQHPRLHPGESPQVASVGPWARTDYALFVGPAGQGEVLLKTVMPGPNVFHHPPGLQRQAETWNHLRGRIARWHSGRAMRGYGLDIVYRRVSLTDSRVCVVFSAEGNTVTLDPQARPGLVYLGYFCPRQGRLDDPEARRFIDALRFRRDDGRDRFGRVPGHPRTPRAVAAARGSAQTGTGNVRFPFRLATPYPENDRSFERP